MKRYKLASRETQPNNTMVHIGAHPVGNGLTQVIAGPCAVESAEQMHQTVSALVRAGIQIIRGGAYKPRTSPYDFQGLGTEGLGLLAEMKKTYGVSVVTELLSTDHVEQVSAVADALQIGTRNAENYDLLRVAARAGRPVILKRGLASTIEGWLASAEYLLANGCGDVILCERGIKTFETSTRSTLDLGGMAWAKLETHLPIIVDPSHAAGTRELVRPLARAALAAGADGLLIEVHSSPDDALCDSRQQWPADRMDELMSDLNPLLRTRDARGRESAVA